MGYFELFSKIVGYVESLNNPYAIRFEEHLYQNYLSRKPNDAVVRYINKCSMRTAFMIMATSWGKYQILGINLYNRLDYDKPIGHYLCDEDEQDISFAEFLKKIIKAQDIEEYSKKIIDELLIFERVKKSYLSHELNKALLEHKDKIPFTINFIRTYNGAIYPSSNFQNYFLRMLHALNKFRKEFSI